MSKLFNYRRLALRLIAMWMLDDYHGNRRTLQEADDLPEGCIGLAAIKALSPHLTAEIYKRIDCSWSRKQLQEFLETEAAIANVRAAV